MNFIALYLILMVPIGLGCLGAAIWVRWDYHKFRKEVYKLSDTIATDIGGLKAKDEAFVNHMSQIDDASAKAVAMSSDMDARVRAIELLFENTSADVEQMQRDIAPS